MTSARYGASRLSTNFSHSCMPIKKVGLMQGKSCIKPGSGLRDCPFLRPAPWLAPKGLQHHTHRRHRSCSTRTTATLVAEPAVLEVKAFSGEATGSARLSLKVADPYTAGGLVHRNVVTIRQNARRGTASTLTRSEVRGGGKKPYAQKGTGNARIGSRRTPLRPGGGVSFGPKPKDWTVKINKKERKLGVATALQSAVDSVTVVEDITGCVKEAKTSLIAAALKKWGVDKCSHTLLIVDEATSALRLSTRNIPTLKLAEASGLNVYDILRADSIIVDAAALTYIQDTFGCRT